MDSERGFYIILPSNVQPDFHPTNTASHYRTTFDHSYSLNEGEWEVALTEISFVNTLPTVVNESFSIESKLQKIGRRFVFETKPDPQYPKFKYYAQNDGTKKSIKYNEWIPNAASLKHIPILLQTYLNPDTTDVHLQVRCVVDTVEANFYMEYNEAKKHGFVALNTHPKRHYIGKKAYFQLWPTPMKSEEVFTAPFASDYYTENAQLEIVTLVDYCTSKEIKISEGNYPSPESLVRALNKETKYPLADWKDRKITKKDPPCNYRFGYKEETNRIMVGVGSETMLTFHHDLDYLLGFSKKIYTEGEYIAEKPPLMNRGIYNIYIYCSLCAPIRVGNVLAPLLRTVEIPAASDWGKVTCLRFTRPMYIPINLTSFNSIEIMLNDDTGAPISFSEGRTTLTLHLRPKQL